MNGKTQTRLSTHIYIYIYIHTHTHIHKTHAALNNKWKHVLVDEWQDTNTPQYELVRLLAANSEKSSVFVVGDIDQSIYSFRGADVRNVYR